MKGRRLADTKIGAFPLDYDDLQPGDHWIVLNRKNGERMNVRDNVEDRVYWDGSGKSGSGWDGNLTGLVLGVMTPTDPPMYGMLSIHTVREEDDGTISVRPGDGSSNSILIEGGSDEGSYHGYIEHGEWTP